MADLLYKSTCVWLGGNPAEKYLGKIKLIAVNVKYNSGVSGFDILWVVSKSHVCQNALCHVSKYTFQAPARRYFLLLVLPTASTWAHCKLVFDAILQKWVLAMFVFVTRLCHFWLFTTSTKNSWQCNALLYYKTKSLVFITLHWEHFQSIHSKSYLGVRLKNVC
jgi:hypothetical protein